MLKEVTCRCGWRVRGTDEEVISQVIEHGRTTHAQELTPDDVRAVWYDVTASAS
jgi:predicted small metal-binding protein